MMILGIIFDSNLTWDQQYSNRNFKIWLLQFVLCIWPIKQVFMRISICVWTMIFERVRTGLLIMLRLITIFWIQNQASTWPRIQTFNFRLEPESRVGTPIHRNLLVIKPARNSNNGRIKGPTWMSQSTSKIGSIRSTTTFRTRDPSLNPSQG